MLGKYNGCGGVCRDLGGSAGRRAAVGGRRSRGFSLVELLAVMAIVTVLMTAASSMLRSVGSRSSEPAARIARAVEMARAQAVAGNRSVAIRFEASGTRELVMRFLRSRPGQAANQAQELRRPERFLDLSISPDIAHPNLPSGESESHDLKPEESLVIDPDGQVRVGTGTSGFPVASAKLLPLIHIGVQPTRAGKVVPAVKRDVAIVQVQCATGTARVVSP